MQVEAVVQNPELLHGDQMIPALVRFEITCHMTSYT